MMNTNTTLAPPSGRRTVLDDAHVGDIGVLVLLSAILTATTLFPKLDVTVLAEVLFAVLAVGLSAAAVYTRDGRRQPASPYAGGDARALWTMPQLELLAKPEWSRTRTVGMYALRGYLLLAVVMLVVKAIEVGLGH
jgi:cobalamin synthase